MARGKKKRTSSRPMRYPNGYGTVSLLSRPERRRFPYAVKVPNGTKTGFNSKGILCTNYVYTPLAYVATWEEGDVLLKEYNNKKKYGTGTVLMSTMTFSDLYELAWPRAEKDIEDSTKKAYLSAYNKHLKALHKVPIKEITVATIQRELDKMVEKRMSQKSVWNAKYVCNIIMSYAYENNLIDKNYADFLDIGKTTKAKEKLPFARAQVETLFKYDNLPFVDTILIYIFTGFRLNELLKVRREDVHIDERYIIGGSKTDAGKDRIVPIHPYIENYVKKWHDRNTEYLITDEKGLSYTKDVYDRIFRKTLKQFDIYLTNHSCRHTLSTMFNNAEVNKVAAQKILGHVGKDLDEKVYIHKNLERLIEAMDKISLEDI